jgi:hypothetical protein
MKKVMFTAFAVWLCLTANVMAQVPNYVPTNGLVGWWPFNGNANDESGNGNNGTVNGATLTADRFGNSSKAYNFDGINDDISVQGLQNININSKISISAWINTNQISTSKNIVSKYGGFNDAFSLDIESTTVKFNVSPGSANWNTCFNNNINLTTNSWHHIVSTYDFANNVFKIYFNGLNVGSINAPFQLGNANNIPVLFGHCYDPNNILSSQRFNGKIDDVGIWNRALTEQEILDLYNGNICYENITVTDTLLINTGITGYNPITYMNTLKIWPNPTNDHITIDAGDLATMNGYSIKIENAQGQQVFQNVVNQQQFYIDITTWGGNGLYFVRIINPQGNTVDIKKIIIQ